jgi:hypothetical protein
MYAIHKVNPASALRNLVGCAVAAAVAAIGVSTPSVADAEPPCATSEVEYTTVARLRIADTKFGAADGVYPLGAGKLRVRFEDSAEGGSKTARLMSYELDNHLAVKASFALWSTTVVTESHTSAATECEGAARGVVQGGALEWSTSVDGYRSDGTVHCKGNVCGQFGAPPPGSSPLHETSTVRLEPFHFDSSGKTFSMGYTRVSHSASPQQTTYVSLSGRETSRVCVTHALVCS